MILSAVVILVVIPVINSLLSRTSGLTNAHKIIIWSLLAMSSVIYGVLRWVTLKEEE